MTQRMMLLLAILASCAFHAIGYNVSPLLFPRSALLKAVSYFDLLAKKQYQF